MDICLYGCGGTGINLGTLMMRDSERTDDSFSGLTLYRIDTSVSNLKDDGLGQTFLIEGLEGCGKKRDSHYNAMKDEVDAILHKMPPGDVNVIIASASGGSGSVLAPIIAAELLKKGAVVFGMLVGNMDSRIEASNCVKTLKSFEAITRLTKRPFNVLFEANRPELSRKEVDHLMTSFMVYLRGVLGSATTELDQSDVANFLDYHKVTDTQPQLSSIEVSLPSFDNATQRSVRPVTVLTLTSTDVASRFHTEVDYQAVAVANDDLAKKIKDLPFHIFTAVGYFHELITATEKKLETFDETKKAIKTKTVTVTDDEANSDGMVF